MESAIYSQEGNTVQSRLEKVKRFSDKHNFLLISFCVFITSYYFVPDERFYKSIFYYVVFTLFLISVNRNVFSHAYRSLIFRYSLLWLGYLAVTVTWSDPLAIKHVESVVRGFLWTGAFLLVTIHLSRQEQKFPEYLFIAVAVVSSATAALAILLLESSPDPSGRLTGIGQIGRHALLTASFYGVAVLTTGFGLAVRAESPRSRLLYAAMLLLLLAALALTASRGPMLGVALAAMVGLVAARRWAIAVAIAVIGAAIVAAGAITDAGPFDFIARGGAYRLEIWSTVIADIREAFWFGHGVATDLPTTVIPNGQSFRTAHQMFLANHFYGGVPATILLLMVLGAAARTAVRVSRAGGSFVHAALLIYMLVVGMTYIDRVIKSANDVWFIVWLPLALLAGQEALLNERASRDNRLAEAQREA